MHTFKLNDEVEVVSYPPTDYPSPVGETGKVVNPRTGSGYIRVGLPGAAQLFQPEELRLVKRELSWLDVKAGDKVTLRVRSTGQEITALATTDNRTTRVLGLGLKAAGATMAWELLKIEGPKPLPPTTPGSLVLVQTVFGDSLPLFLQPPGGWMSSSGAAWSVSKIRDAGFEVVHDEKDML